MALKMKKLKCSPPVNIGHLDTFIMITINFYNFDIISIAFIKKIAIIIQSIDKNTYSQDEKFDKRIKVLKEIIKKIIKDKLRYRDDILNSLTTTRVKNYYEDIISEVEENYSMRPFDEAEIYYIDKLISNWIKMDSIFYYRSLIENSLKDIENIENGEMDDIDIESSLEIFQSNIQHINRELNTYSQVSLDSANDFTSEKDSAMTMLKKTHKKVNRPNNKLITGIQMKNKFLDGGYELGRFYLWLGLQGMGKSSELLRTALEMKHYNDSIIDGKKAVIIYLSQENSNFETFERIWSYYNGNSIDLKDLSLEECERKILEETDFCNPKDCILQVKFRKTHTIDVDDVATIIDDVESDGDKKVICVIHDYMKRFNSTRLLPNAYEELGQASDEFCALAKDKDICIISAHQFNRDALKIIEAALRSGKLDPLKEVTSAEISESVRLLDNADYIYCLFPTKDPTTGNPMITYKRLKRRGKKPKEDIPYFAHPYCENNTMRLQPDLFLTKSLSKLNLADGLEDFNSPVTNRVKKKKVSGGRQSSNYEDEKQNVDKILNIGEDDKEINIDDEDINKITKPKKKRK